ncbi:unnamed protein product [Cuscuta epithymum]|uniref:Reverse transcriptase domain-containing protein n=1 Tax=Cuscuta epithymum TaxID=186058 RepID=A0AAV0DZS7_9ASTE|nr:unnamed protein product [Cuscuta epithymum]
MPFGLCNAPSTFQAAMNEIFRSYLRGFILVFFDDILIYSKTWAAHLDHLRRTLQILQEHRFHIKPSKCFFALTEVEYLGHYISNEGVRVDPRKIEAMCQWPRPTSINALREFVGLTGYYRKFVREYGLIARPLTQLLKKGQFSWSSEATLAFENLKKAVSTTPVLALPDFTKEFCIETDASGQGIGAVLSQGRWPIAFMSKALGPTKQAWSTYAKEMLAVLEAVRIWRTYLLGRRFIIYTDQKSLRHLIEQRITTPEQQKWIAKLLGFDYEIIYKPGATNKVADALSRREHLEKGAELTAISGPLWEVWNEIRTLTQEDTRLQEIHSKILNKEAEVADYEFRNGCILFQGKVLIPGNQSLRKKLIHEFHNTPAGGHSGMLRTFNRLNQIFTWPGMRGAVSQYVRECEVCQRTKINSLAPGGLLSPLPIPTAVWADVTMDFIEGLPTSGGKNSIFVIVD